VLAKTPVPELPKRVVASKLQRMLLAPMLPSTEQAQKLPRRSLAQWLPKKHQALLPTASRLMLA